MDIDVDTDVVLSINVVPLTDDTDFKTQELGILYNQAGMSLKWNFITTAGVFTQVGITPTTGGGDYDWVNKSWGMYSVTMPASGGTQANNNIEGTGWFSGRCDGVLTWISERYTFKPAALNNLLVNTASLPTDIATLVAMIQAGGYEDKKVCIHNGGTAGTTPYINGTNTNPVASLADALTIAAALKLDGIYIDRSYTAMLTANVDNMLVDGNGYDLNFAGYSVDGATFRDAGDVIGTFTGRPMIYDSHIDVITGPGAQFENCSLDHMTANVEGDWNFDKCFTNFSGDASGAFDYGAVGAVKATFTHFSGAIEITNMSNNDALVIEGTGALRIHASCVGGTITVGGHFALTGKTDFLANGGIIHESGNFNTTTLLEELPTTLLLAGIATVVSQREVTLSEGATSDDAYINCLAVLKDDATEEKLSVNTILSYTASTKTLKFRGDPKFTIAPGDDITIIADQAGINSDMAGSYAIDFQYYITGGVTPMAGVAVSIWNEDMTLFLGRVYTDENGQAETGLDAGTYKIVAMKTDTEFANVPEILVVDGNESVTYYGDTFVVPIPGDPLQCNVYIDLVDLGVAKEAGIEFVANLNPVRSQKVGTGSLLNAQPYSDSTDSNGRIIMPLAKGFAFTITSRALGKYNQKVEIDTTDKDTLILADEI